ncbi:hypothetical protein BHE74_00037188 [Ensete ventricosum]|nr:hypothetical protein BHE74_00037188 [Ensete ventricosum]
MNWPGSNTRKLIRPSWGSRNKQVSFRLCKSRGGYYLTAHVGFKVSGAPSNNKGEVGKAEELDEDLERSVGRGGVREGTSASTVGMRIVYTPVGGATSLSRQRDGAGNFRPLPHFLGLFH